MVEDNAAFHAMVYGRVQGVYFRAYVLEQAQQLDVAGYVRNVRHPTAVEVEGEGEKVALETLVQRLHQGPAGAWVERVDVEWRSYGGRFTGFSIR